MYSNQFLKVNKMKQLSFVFLLSLLTIASQSVIGGILPKDQRNDALNFTFKDINGEEVSLSDFKGKVVYMDLWGSWCRPCLHEMPSSRKLRETYSGNENVVFLFVAVMEKTEEGWKAAVEKHVQGGVNLRSQDEPGSEFRNFYDKGYVPHYFLIDKDGKMADPKAKRPSEKGLEEDIKALLSE